MSEKGYIFKKNDRWEVHFIVGVGELDENGHLPVVAEKYNDYATWDMAFFAMKKKQKGFK